MSIYGMQVKNSAGNMIIDGVYKNFSEYESGTVTLLNGTFVTVNFTPTPQIPLVAIKPSTGCYCTVFGYIKSGSNWTGFTIIRSAGATNYDVNYKVYTAHPATPVSTYGLNIYNPSGELVFDSGNKYFNIYAVETGITFGDGYPEDRYQTITHAGISDPYYVISPIAWWEFGVVQPNQGPVFFFKTGIQKVNATSVKVGWNMFMSGITNYAHSDGWNPTINLVVLK